MVLAIELEGAKRPVGMADGRPVFRVTNVRGVNFAQPLDRFSRDRQGLLRAAALSQKIGQLVKRLAMPEAVRDHLGMVAGEQRVVSEPLSIESLCFPSRFLVAVSVGQADVGRGQLGERVRLTRSLGDELFPDGRARSRKSRASVRPTGASLDELGQIAQGRRGDVVISRLGRKTGPQPFGHPTASTRARSASDERPRAVRARDCSTRSETSLASSALPLEDDLAAAVLGPDSIGVALEGLRAAPHVEEEKGELFQNDCQLLAECADRPRE